MLKQRQASCGFTAAVELRFQAGDPRGEGFGSPRRGHALRGLMVAAAFACSCSDADRLGLDFDFAQGPQGWVAGFADYPAGGEASFRLVADYRSLPEPLDTSRGALFISGVNRSDDLFMFHKWRGGLRPNTSYRVTFEVEIATAVPIGRSSVPPSRTS